MKLTELKCPACERVGKFKQYSGVIWNTGSYNIITCECGERATTDVPRFRFSDYTRNLLEINDISSLQEIKNPSVSFLESIEAKFIYGTP